MNQLIKKLLRKLGFDRAITFGILARSWGLISGPVTMLVIASGLSPQEQGFYFTFASLLGLQIFFDLGLMYVLAQFASHEFVSLSWGTAGRLEGDPIAIRRFTDLLCKSILWFAVAALLLILLLIPAGLIFFGGKEGVDFVWRIPWILAVIGVALNLVVMPFFSLIMGSGDVVTVNKRELFAALASSLLCWVAILSGGGLYAAFAVNMGAFAISCGYLLKRRPEFLKLAWGGWQGVERKVRTGPGGLSWRCEVWPMQWRMAISSGASYFIFQLFNPVLFHYHGPVVAGQMGMTLTAANALLGASMTILHARTPEFAKLIALGDWPSLDRYFFQTTRKALLLALFGAAAGFLVIWQLQASWSIGARFIPAWQAAILFANVILQVLSGALCNYLRAHKQEPLVLMTIISSLLQGGATWYFAMNYAAAGAVTGYLAVTLLFSLPYTFVVWQRCRREWH